MILHNNERSNCIFGCLFVLAGMILLSLAAIYFMIFLVGFIGLKLFSPLMGAHFRAPFLPFFFGLDFILQGLGKFLQLLCERITGLFFTGSPQII